MDPTGSGPAIVLVLAQLKKCSKLRFSILDWNGVRSIFGTEVGLEGRNARAALRCSVYTAIGESEERSLVMKVKTLSMMAAAGSMLLLGSAAQADLVGIEGVVTTVDLRTDGNPFGGAPLETFDSWRIYAVFDDTTDQLTGVAGNTAVANAIQLSTSIGTFYNFFLGAGNNAAQAGLTGSNEENFDSWLEIGRTTSGVGVGTGETPGFPVLGNGISNFTVTNGAYFRTPDDTLTIAGADNRVIFAQLTVPAGARIDGLVRLNVDTSATPGGGTIDNITFNFSTPAPGALALLGLAGLAGGRRRRRA